MCVNTARVGQLSQQVGVRLQERTERRAKMERPVANPRAARLRELQLEPPEWLIEAIRHATHPRQERRRRCTSLAPCRARDRRPPPRLRLALKTT
jgi:hypothetical protein